MSFAEDYLPTIKESNRRLITLFFICLRYVFVTIGFAALTTFAKWCIAGDHVASANTVIDLTFAVFYLAICSVFLVHLALFIFWRDR